MLSWERCCEQGWPQERVDPGDNWIVSIGHNERTSTLTSNSCVYAASLYTNNRYGTEWFVYLGATACGITAGVFWAAEGAIMIGCELFLFANSYSY